MHALQVRTCCLVRVDVAQLHYSGTDLNAPDLLLMAPNFPASNPMCLLLQILFNINGCCRPGEGEAVSKTAFGARLQFLPKMLAIVGQLQRVPVLG